MVIPFGMALLCIVPNFKSRRPFNSASLVVIDVNLNADVFSSASKSQT